MKSGAEDVKHGLNSGQISSQHNVVQVLGQRLGHLVGVSDGVARVHYSGNPHGPVEAQTTIPLDSLIQDEPRMLLLAFIDQRSDRPVIIGQLVTKEASESAPAVADERPASSEPASSPALSATVDGRRVTLEAEEEVVIRCGEASITLRKNGRLHIRGVRVETRAKGVNRIKGGSVQIN